MTIRKYANPYAGFSMTGDPAQDAMLNSNVIRFATYAPKPDIKGTQPLVPVIGKSYAMHEVPIYPVMPIPAMREKLATARLNQMMQHKVLKEFSGKAGVSYDPRRHLSRVVYEKDADGSLFPRIIGPDKNAQDEVKRILDVANKELEKDQEAKKLFDENKLKWFAKHHADDTGIDIATSVALPRVMKVLGNRFGGVIPTTLGAVGKVAYPVWMANMAAELGYLGGSWISQTYIKPYENKYALDMLRNKAGIHLMRNMSTEALERMAAYGETAKKMGSLGDDTARYNAVVRDVLRRNGIPFSGGNFKDAKALSAFLESADKVLTAAGEDGATEDQQADAFLLRHWLYRAQPALIGLSKGADLPLGEFKYNKDTDTWEAPINGIAADAELIYDPLKDSDHPINRMGEALARTHNPSLPTADKGYKGTFVTDLNYNPELKVAGYTHGDYVYPIRRVSINGKTGEVAYSNRPVMVVPGDVLQMLREGADAEDTAMYDKLFPGTVQPEAVPVSRTQSGGTVAVATQDPVADQRQTKAWQDFYKFNYSDPMEWFKRGAGAAAGASVGALLGGKNKLLGAGLGAVAGYAAGSYADRLPEWWDRLVAATKR